MSRRHYIDGRVLRAEIAHSVTPHVIIRHVDADGRLVDDPPATVRLFRFETLNSVQCDAAGNPLARLEPGWTSVFVEEAYHAA